MGSTQWKDQAICLPGQQIPYFRRSMWPHNRSRLRCMTTCVMTITHINIFPLDCRTKFPSQSFLPGTKACVDELGNLTNILMSCGCKHRACCVSKRWSSTCSKNLFDASLMLSNKHERISCLIVVIMKLRSQIGMVWKSPGRRMHLELLLPRYTI